MSKTRSLLIFIILFQRLLLKVIEILVRLSE